MGPDVRATLVAEGRSDLLLAPHLAILCIEAGAREAVCRAPDLALLPRSVGSTVQAKVEAALELHPDTNLLFVHRDADRAGVEAREREIEEGTRSVRAPVVPIVPVAELEAWLLVDEGAIRDAVGRRSSTASLNLPSIGACERLADPKGRLQEAVDIAQQDVAKRRRSSFGLVRSRLLERLDLAGPIRELSAFQRLMSGIEQAVGKLAA